MAAAISPTTGRRYGIAQACRIWDVPRSSFYATGSGPTPRGQSWRSVVGRSRRCPTTPCWRRSAPVTLSATS